MATTETPPGLIPSPRDGGKWLSSTNSDDQSIWLSFHLDSEVQAALRKLAPEGNFGELVSRALAFYAAAAEANREGKHVGVTGDADALDIEYVGF